MENNPRQEPDHSHALAGKDRAEKSCRFKGIGFRKWGSWVSEIRVPRSREKLWLGSYSTAEQAARAYDAAVYCLRGPSSIFNFPDSVPSIPSASSLSRNQIQLAAARYATLDRLPSISPSSHDTNENVNANKKEEAAAAAMEDSASPSRSASVQQELELPFWESLLAGSGDWHTQNLERLPSIDEALALNLIPSREEQNHEREEEDVNNFFQLTDLRNFRDV